MSPAPRPRTPSASPSAAGVARRAGTLLGAVLAAWAVSCSEEGDRPGLPDPPGIPVDIDRADFLLVDRPTLMRVLEEDEEAPVDFGMLLPRPSSTQDAGPLPSVRMSPPAAVEFRLPELPPGAELAFAVGVDHEGYGARGRQLVRFSVELDGEAVFHEELLASQRVPKAQQRWTRGRVPVHGVERVVLRTDFEGTLDVKPRVGFGLLEVRVPLRTYRTQATPAQPNVLLVLIDTLRADRLGAYVESADALPTPHLDALAARGTLFERCYASAPWTWPSTASLFTGRTPPAHGVESEVACFLSHDLVTLAEVFQEHHLRTAAFSTNTLIGPAKNFDQGFESFHLDPWAPTREIYGGIETWLRGAASSRFFLYLHLTDPHSPYEPDADLRAALGPDPEGWSQGETWREIQKRFGSDSSSTGPGGDEPFDEERVRRFAAHDAALYDAEVQGLDRQLGRLFGLLDELGLRETTLVCVTSDHGEEFFEHGMYHHTKQLYEEVLRVPLIVAGPGIEAGVRIAEPVGLRHLGATLLARAGADAGALGGVDLLDGAARAAALPLFFSTSVGWWFDESAEEIVLQESELYGSLEGLRRFVWAPGELDGARDLTRLFDLEQDPYELRDLSAEVSPEEIEKRRAALEAWLVESASVRPQTYGGDADALEALRALGYLGED